MLSKKKIIVIFALLLLEIADLVLLYQSGGVSKVFWGIIIDIVCFFIGGILLTFKSTIL